MKLNRRHFIGAMVAGSAGLVSTKSFAATLCGEMPALLPEALAALDPDWFSANRTDVLLFEHLLDPVRNEPAFHRLIEQLGLREANARAEAWRAAHPSAKAAPAS